MPQTQIQADARRRELLKMLSCGQSLSTMQMAKRLGVNPMTIRRDLKALAESGAAIRCYGGAMAAQRITFEFEFDQRHRRNLEQKERIGQAAAATITPGQTILLDTGTTTVEIAKALARRDVSCTVITSSLVVASHLWGRREVELILLGGRVRHGSPDLAGPLTEMMLGRMTADVAFLGSDGIDVRRGSFAGDFEVARVAEGMASSARRVVVAADASKLGAPGAALVVPVEKIDELITDRAAGAAAVKALRARGVKVTLV